MAKLHRHGQATPINEFAYHKIRKNTLQENHKLLLDIAYYTGERWGAILQLQVGDIYADPSKRSLLNQITFRASTRKGGKDTRQVPIAPDLAIKLKAIAPPVSGWLFPGEKMGDHLTLRAADRMLRRALERAGLADQGYSTHSFRRGFITDLHNRGLSVKVIQSLTGHKSLQVLSRYIEISEQQRAAAIALR